ncbi:hypothetical protein NL676_033969 [Syzygium grande]|nr:hypothetical protein NL676_033969 [Syzygium grande]
MAVILAVLAVGLASVDPLVHGWVQVLVVCAVASALDVRIRRRNTDLAKLMWSAVMVLAFPMGLRYLNVETQASLFVVWVALSVLRVLPGGKFTGGAELLRDFGMGLLGCFALRYLRMEIYALAQAVWTLLPPLPPVRNAGAGRPGYSEHGGRILLVDLYLG